MATHVYSSAAIGLGGVVVDVECDLTKSLPNIVIVGMVNRSVDESKERIRSALVNSGFQVPRKRITLNLAPADLPKDGSAYDIAMSLAILIASEQIKVSVSKSVFVGELSLDGNTRHIPAILSHIDTAIKEGFESIFIPSSNKSQAALLADKIKITLLVLCASYTGT